MKNICIIIIGMLLVAAPVSAQNAAYNKMSTLVRKAARTSATGAKRSPASCSRPVYITAFVRATDDGIAVLEENGGIILTRLGDVYIASIPTDRLEALVSNAGIERIEARSSCSLTMDITPSKVDALPVYSGAGLPLAYTGKGVVMGLQDVGFDLTHPNFYNTSLSEYRIKRFWDQLSADNSGSAMYVGAEYTTEDAIKAYAHSRDGFIESHGTHTLGIAAGSGYDSPYRGMAYESDICLVSNAVTSDTVFIADEDLYKYTSATDVLGFKYIFDYADEMGKPCVISFSEGSHQDFSGEDMLMYEALQELVGPGRIIVASAGNEGHIKTYFRKQPGTVGQGSFLSSDGKRAYLKMLADKPFDIRLTAYSSSDSEEFVVNTDDILKREDGELVKDVTLLGDKYNIDIVGYASCYDAEKTAYEMLITSAGSFGDGKPVSVEVSGRDADVEVYRGIGYFVENSKAPWLNAGELTHSIYVPGSAPAVICVGATAHRSAVENYKGDMVGVDWGNDGRRAGYSSVGPTYDGRTKPDVVAPGTNVISSYSSYYLENLPEYYAWDTSRFTFNGRTYAWSNSMGTSMSTPVVGGAVALWLQANPRLTPDDIRGVLARTCNKYDKTAEYPNNYYGYGEIDVYRGLLDILGLTDIDGISCNRPGKAHITLSSEGRLSIIFDGLIEVPFTLSVYTTGGMKVFTEELKATSSPATTDMSSLPHGVYLVQITSAVKDVTGSILIRW